MQGKATFIGGGEESYGYLIGEFVRDKDAIVSGAFISEMTAFYKDKGSSLFEALVETYLEYGFYKETLISITKKGQSGAQEIKDMMSKYRSNPPKTLGGSKVIALKDYENREETDLDTNTKKPIDLPKSDVLQFISEDGTVVSARPSGTEPKIKFYCSVNTKLASKEAFAETEKALDEKIKVVMTDLGLE